MLEKQRILFHGSKEIVEFPEIRMAKLIKIFILDFIVHYFQSRLIVGQSGIQGVE